MSDTAKSMLLTDEEMDEIMSKLGYVEVSTYPTKPMHREISNRTMREAIAKAQLLKLADWIKKQEEDNTHLHIGDLVSKLLETAETDVL